MNEANTCRCPIANVLCQCVATCRIYHAQIVDQAPLEYAQQRGAILLIIHSRFIHDKTFWPWRSFI